MITIDHTRGADAAINQIGLSAAVVSSAAQPIPNAAHTPILLDVENWDDADFHDNTVQESGTATGGTGTTLIDTGKVWTVNAYQNMVVKITGGTGIGQVRLVSSNTATELTVPTWTTNPDATSIYQILISNRLYAPVAKKYLIIATITYSGDATGIRGLSLWKNSVFIAPPKYINPTGDVETNNQLSAVIELNAGDFIEMRGYQSSGGVLNTVSTGGGRVGLQIISI